MSTSDPLPSSSNSVSSLTSQPRELAVHTSYDGSNLVSHLLRMETWGPALMNLGYFPFRRPFTSLNVLVNMEQAQRVLVMKSAALLKLQPGQRVLDVACGRGKSSFILKCLEPGSTIIGMDLLEENIHVARTLFSQMMALSYQQGDAQQIPFESNLFDRLMCVEAAFHFPDRALFLQESFRVLRPGGRMVLVDFAWTNESHRDDPGTRLVRDVWQWDDFYTKAQYDAELKRAGLSLVEQQDWTSRVATPIQAVFKFLVDLGNTSWGRRFLEWRNPLYRSISPADWKELAVAVQAHHHVRSLSRYMVYVLEKPIQ